MAIDFHDPANRHTYATRDAGDGWHQAMSHILARHGPRSRERKHVADVGCGGGIYAYAWLTFGVKSVTGIDFSLEMLTAAQERFGGTPGLKFQRGEADDTGLPSGGIGIVHERALIHHLKDYGPAFREACRALEPHGLFIVQDRTPEDVALPGDMTHLRGYFFEKFPRLSAFEAGRRPSSEKVEAAMVEAGFTDVQHYTVWETRETYEEFSLLEKDLAARTGRSILHELSDDELRELIAFIKGKLPPGPIVEKDRWTIWVGVKP